MNSQNDKEGSGRDRTAIIAGIFVIVGACITGVFLTLNTLIGKGTIVIPPSPISTALIQPSEISPNNPIATEFLPTFAPTLTSPPATQAPSVSTFEVYANLSWQDTGIQIKSGDRLRIIWDGKSKWRGVNSGDFSDPLGGYIDPNSNYSCPPLMPAEQAGWNALVSKIGENGTPTNPFKSIPLGEGTLRLAMNDCKEQRYDNEGSVTVTIEIQH